MILKKFATRPGKRRGLRADKIKINHEKKCLLAPKWTCQIYFDFCQHVVFYLVDDILLILSAFVEIILCLCIVKSSAVYFILFCCVILWRMWTFKLWAVGAIFLLYWDYRNSIVYFPLWNIEPLSPTFFMP